MRNRWYLIPALLITIFIGSAALSNNGKTRPHAAQHAQPVASPIRPKSNTAETVPAEDASRAGVSATSVREKQSGAPLTLSAAADISGSVLNSREGREGVEALRQSIPDALQPGDQFQLLLFYGDEALTTVAPGPWGEGAAGALSSLLKLRIRPGDRTKYSVVLDQLNKSTPKNTLALILTDGVISTGSQRGDDEERERSLAAAATFVSRGGRAVIVPVATGKTQADGVDWLASALKARKISAAELRAGALRAALSEVRTAALQESGGARAEPATTRGGMPSRVATLILILALASAIAALLWMRRRRRPKPPATQAPKEELAPLRLKISRAHADDEEFTTSMVEAREAVTIGGSETDTVRQEGLIPGHVRLYFSNDETRVEAHGPLRLDGGVDLEPNGTPVTEIFPSGEEVAFSAGKMTYLIERLPPGKE